MEPSRVIIPVGHSTSERTDTLDDENRRRSPACKQLQVGSYAGGEPGKTCSVDLTQAAMKLLTAGDPVYRL